MPHLGFPLEGPFPGWMLTVITGTDDAGRPMLTPVAFSSDQAKEIARRIIAYYGDVNAADS